MAEGGSEAHAASGHDAGTGHDAGDAPRAARPGLGLVALGIVLLGVAAWSSARARIGGRWDEAVSPGDADAGGLGGDVLLVVLGAATAVVVSVGVLFVVSLITGRGRPGRRGGGPSRPWWIRSLVGVAAICLAVLVVALLVSGDDPARVEPVVGPVAPTPTGDGAEPGGGSTGWDALALVGAGAALAAVAGALLWRRSRGRRQAVAAVRAARRAEEALRSLDLDALAPSEAVRTAYAAALQRLGVLGLRWQAPETPYEYLARVRRARPDAAGPLEVLTRRYEVARYSSHPVDEAMRADAVAAYHRLDELVEEALRPVAEPAGAAP